MHPDTPLNEYFRLTPAQKTGLEKLKLKTPTQLLLYLPSRYQNQGLARNINELKNGDQASVAGQITKTKVSKGFRTKIAMGEVTIEDATGKIKAIWFNQPYLAKKLTLGETVQLTGKVAERKGVLYLANPDLIQGKEVTTLNSLFNSKENINSIIPVYSETKGISSGWIYYHIQKLLAEKVHEKMIDPLPDNLRTKYHLPALATSLVWIHSPQNQKDAESARKRFAFQEIFFIQLARMKARATYLQNKTYQVPIESRALTEFTNRFPFALTKAQTQAIETIIKDLHKKEPMMRLLEGDVGSGKTAVAASTTYAVVKAGFEVAYMAPTEILAKQHFESFIQYFAHLNVQIGLLTSSECRKFPSKINPHEHTHISKPQLLRWVAEGQIPIVIGTHSLIQKSVKFKNLAFAIIDEQHRFGTKQRSELIKKNHTTAPHLLSMTATPIPRTLALTIYGDLDLSLLDEMPKGRKPIKTEIVPKDKREEMYTQIRSELNLGRQAYVICPRIDEPDPTKAMALNAKSAKSEQKRLAQNIFPHNTVGLMHSKLSPKVKEETMRAFTAGEIDILVSTSVVEVGVNVPNATIIIIEGAERYGLAQLHQLRGRVMRSEHQAYCFLLTESTAETARKRLSALVQAKNGFELAELDLALRGAGALIGGKQWGISDLGMEAIRNLKLVEIAREEAKNIIAKDPNLEHYPLLKKEALSDNALIHFE